MASIQARTWTDQKGKQRTSYRVQVRLKGFPPETASFARRTDAKEWGQAREAAMLDGRHFPQREAKRRTLAELVERRLEAIRVKRPHAYIGAQRILGWWKDRLGDYTLAQVTPPLLAAYRDRLLAEDRGPATTNRYLASLSKAFSVAVKEWHWLHDNPLRQVQKESEPTGRVRCLSDKEREALLAACRQSKLPELRLIVLLALTTGARRGEILGLNWQDVDLDRRLLAITKSKNGEPRSVPIVPEVAALLREHGRVRRLESDLVFPSGGGKAVYFDKHWRKARRVAKIKDFRFHDLRHTAASYLSMSGATVPELAAVLGHKTLLMVKRYSHPNAEHVAGVVERMTRKYFSA